MVFNSLEFIVFLPLVFIAFWLLNRWTHEQQGIDAQNLLLVLVSYIFYGWWDARFLSLIAFSTAVDFFVGLKIAKANESIASAPPDVRSQGARKWLFLSLAVNLGLLGYFKYANFFIESWVEAWASVGLQVHISTLQIILPVGISFYTFQTLSYSIDVYRRKLQPTRNFIAFSAFVSFFPQLVAGPIERASALLPQISQRRIFDHELATSGIRLILWGMFKKVMIADTCAVYVDDIFSNYSAYPGPTLVLGALLFSFQIYGDFSGYSDIAIGSARLFGIRLMTNFKAPYLSRDIAEFWRRWHISLSGWFRDYLYIPLGGSKAGKKKAVRNTFLIFIVSGFWHGANWTFLVWGGLHALLFLPLLLANKNRRYSTNHFAISSPREFFGILLTFCTVVVTWVFFRADNLEHAFGYLSGWTTLPDSWLGYKWILPANAMRSDFLAILFSLILLLIVETILSTGVHLDRLKTHLRRWEPVYWALGIVVIMMSPGLDKDVAFIYFAF